MKAEHSEGNSGSRLLYSTLFLSFSRLAWTALWNVECIWLVVSFTSSQADRNALDADIRPVMHKRNHSK